MLAPPETDNSRVKGLIRAAGLLHAGRHANKLAGSWFHDKPDNRSLTITHNGQFEGPGDVTYPPLHLRPGTL